MYPNPNITHQHLTEHLETLRQEAAQARLVPVRPGFLTPVLNLFRRRGRPIAAQTGVRHT